MGTEYPELFEKIDRLDREMDVHAALLESLTDRTSAGEYEVLQLVADVEAMRRARKIKKKGSPTPSQAMQE